MDDLHDWSYEYTRFKHCSVNLMDMYMSLEKYSPPVLLLHGTLVEFHHRVITHFYIQFIVFRCTNLTYLATMSFRASILDKTCIMLYGGC